MILGVDIGATKTKVILWDKRNKRIKKKAIFDTPKRKNGFLFVLEKELERFISDNQTKIREVGLGIPGVLDKKREKILCVPHLKFLSQINLKNSLKKMFNKEIKMENDAVCFTMAEAILGTAQKEKNVLGITLGTGVGGGLLFREGKRIRIYKGFFGTALEPGAMVIDVRRERESFEKSRLDWFGSKDFFLERRASPKEFYQRAQRGNKKAILVFRKYGEILGIEIANLINIIDPEIIVLGGGISGAFRFFFPSLRKTVKNLVLSPYSRKFVKIKKGKLGDFAGAIGAALLFQYDKN